MPKVELLTTQTEMKVSPDQFPWVRITFVDAAGRYWERLEDGTIQ
jgi:hypothetical protein